MKIILFTDGSWNPFSKAGAFAYRAMNEEGQILCQGGGHALDTGINRMEIRAVSVALCELRPLYSGDEVVLHTDSANLIRWISKSALKSKDEAVQKELDELERMLTAGGFQLSTMKVAAHTGVVHNEWCDVTAKEHLKVALKKVEQRQKAEGRPTPAVPSVEGKAPAPLFEEKVSEQASSNRQKPSAVILEPPADQEATSLTLHVSAQGTRWKAHIGNDWSISGQGGADNIDALFQAIEQGLQQIPQGSKVKIASNSLNHINWLNGSYRAKQPRIVAWLENIRSLASKRQLHLHT